MAFLGRLLNVFRRARLERELDEELEFHRQMRLNRSLGSGLSPAEAELEAKRRMGNLSIAKEEMREQRVVAWMESTLQDLRHGIVLLRRDAGLSALIILVLALGIGGNAAILTLLKAAFLDPLPFREADRLVTVTDRYSAIGVNEIGPTVPEFLDMRARSRLLDSMAFLDFRDFQLTGAEEPLRVFAARVTASFFPALGMDAALGRTLMPSENLPGQTNVVVLSDNFWRSHMAGDRDAVGKTLRLNGDPHTIVGVLPPGFGFDYPSLGVPERVEIYVPFLMDDNYTLRSGSHANARRVRVLARLRGGESVEGANAELQTIAATLIREYPQLYQGPKRQPIGFSLEAQPLREAIIGKERPQLWLLLGGVGVLLMIACANTAQLLLARSLQRGKEVAVRAALGASRTRLIRQFLIEGFVLAICGGIAGLVLSGWLTRIVVALLPAHNPIFEAARPDARIIAVTLALSLFSALLFAIIPAIKGSAWTLGPSLTTRVAAGQGNRWRHAMIAIEAALSVFLLCGAGLIGQNLWNLISTFAGFDAQNVTVMQIRMPYRREQALNPNPSRGYQEYLERIAAVPGVESAAAVTGLPLRGAMETGFRIVGDPDDPGALTRQMALVQFVSPDYFRTLRIPLISGRGFRDDDVAGRPGVAIVNQEFARRFSRGTELVGRQLAGERPATIIAVVGNVRMSALKTAPEPQIYRSYLQAYEPNTNLIVRSQLPQAQLISRVKEAIRSVYPDQAVFNASTMQQVLSHSVAEPRFRALLISAFALLALVMAACGLYSVISCLVGHRTGEIAIRIALGAGRAAIIRSIVGTTSIWVLGGLAAGIGIALAAAGTIRKLSQSAAPSMPATYVAIVLFFLVVTLLAAYLPVRRAVRLDPARALRCE